MSLLHGFPYTNFHDLNLDMILEEIKKLMNEFDDFKVVNSISFKGEWNINNPYQRWSLVDLNGFGYLSIKAVPIGVNITNEEYWILVANYSAIYANFQNRVIALENSVITLQSGLNSVTTKVNNLKIANVKDFGAIGDGITDDTASIRNAINYCLTNGNGVLFFPDGIYLVTETINYRTSSGQFLSFEGTISSTIKYTGTGYLFDITTSDESDSYIKNIRFLGNQSNNCLHLYETVNWYIDKCEFRNFYNAIAITGEVDQTQIVNCYFIGIYNNGILMDASTAVNVNVDMCHFRGLMTGTKAINYKNARNFSITNTTLQSGSQFTPIKLDSCHRSDIHQLYCESNAAFSSQNSLVEIIDSTHIDIENVHSTGAFWFLYTVSNSTDINITGPTHGYSGGYPRYLVNNDTVSTIYLDTKNFTLTNMQVSVNRLTSVKGTTYVRDNNLRQCETQYGNLAVNGERSIDLSNYVNNVLEITIQALNLQSMYKAELLVLSSGISIYPIIDQKAPGVNTSLVQLTSNGLVLTTKSLYGGTATFVTSIEIKDKVVNYLN